MNVVVTDVNDCAPEFERSEYIVNVSESADINQRLLQVQAVSEDAEQNAKISYALVPGNDVDKFSLDEETG